MKFRRFIAMLLCLILMITPYTSVMAVTVEEMAKNSAAENQSILRQLTDFAGDDVQEAYDLLDQLGLLDEDGNPDLDQDVLLNGERLSIEEVEELLESGSVNPEEIAYVDDTPIALGDLKTIIGIERELTRIAETYFTGSTFTPEQIESLTDMLSQAEEMGLYLEGGAEQNDNNKPKPEPVSDHWVVDVREDPKPLPQNSDFLYFPPSTIHAGQEIDITGCIGYALSIDNQSQWSYPSVYLYRYWEGKMKGEYAYKLEYDLTDSKKCTVETDGEYSLVIRPGYYGEGIFDIAQHHSYFGDWYTAVMFADVQGMSFLIDDGTENGREVTSYTYLHKESLEEITTKTYYSGYNEVNDQKFGYLNTTLISDELEFSWCDTSDEDQKAEWDSFARLYEAVAEAESRYPSLTYSLSLTVDNVSNNGSRFQANEVTNDYNWDVKLPKEMTSGYDYKIQFLDNSSTPKLSQNIKINYSHLYLMPLTLTTTNTSAKAEIRIGDVYGLKSDSYSQYNEYLHVGKNKHYDYTYTMVPISLLFDTLVYVDKDSTITINGEKFNMLDIGSSIAGSQLVVWYIPKYNDSEIVINAIEGVKNVYNQEYTLSKPISNIASFEPYLLRNTAAVSKFSASSATDDTDVGKTVITVTANLNTDEAYRQVFSNNAKAYKARIIDNATRETIEVIPLEMGNALEVLKGEYTIDRPAGDRGYTVRMIVNEDDREWEMYSMQDTFTAAGIEFVNGLDITYSSDERTLELGDKTSTALGVSFDGNPTFTTGTWTSSDESIATIDQRNGTITLSGGIGEVYFTFTADDGGKYTDPDETHVKSKSSAIFTVEKGLNPALIIPENSNMVLARFGESARVLWSSNAEYYTTEDFAYKIELFEGNLSFDELTNSKLVYWIEVSKTLSAEIPAEYLTKLSDGADAAYTVCISMPNPKVAGERMSVLSYIRVIPLPASVKLTSPTGNGYLLDNVGKVNISWEIDEYTASTEGLLTITRVTSESIQSENKEEASEVIYSTNAMSESGTYQLDLNSNKVPSSRLKDTYMVQMQVRNYEKDGWSVDSFPMYVYRADFLSLVDKNNNDLGDKISLDNTEKVSKYNTTSGGSQTTAEILKLRETLGLYAYAGVNYDSEQWKLRLDAIKWESSDATVSINYAQNGVYRDIDTYDFETYIPSIQMMLSSIKDGKATVKATHANTGAVDSVEVEVTTLKNKFYLFQFKPSTQTSLTYTDGIGTEKTVYTNKDGMLALYEPNGITGNINLKSKDGDDIYLGTMYAENLYTGERNHASLDLYPLNTYKLRQAAKAEMYLLKPDGTPFSGSVTLRGGVYKNDGFCQDALIGSDAENLKDGSVGYTYTVDKTGKLTVYMDSTQFWSTELGETSSAGAALSASDTVQYIFEVTDIENDKYYPLLITEDGELSPTDIMLSAENIVELKEVPTNAANSLFVAEQTVSYANVKPKDVSRFNGYVGPNAICPEASVVTKILLWGVEKETAKGNFELQMVDKNGVVPECQTSTVKIYPFSTIPVVENIMTLNNKTMTGSGWLDEKAGRRTVGLSMRLYERQKLLREFPVYFKVVDMTHVNEADVKDAKKVSDILSKVSDVSTLINGSWKDKVSLITDNKVLITLAGTITSMQLTPVSQLKMIISPTESNTTFKAMIYVGYDQLQLPALDYNKQGIATSFDYLQGSRGMTSSSSDMKSLAKSGYTAANGNKQEAPVVRSAMTTPGANKLSYTSVRGRMELSGFYEIEITYDFARGEWVVHSTGGGITGGAGVDIAKNITEVVGPVSVTLTFQLSGSVELSRKVAMRYNEITVHNVENGNDVNEVLKWATGHDRVEDYLTTLRLQAYFEAFGGAGVDLSILALKIGLSGRITVDFEADYLERSYLALKELQKEEGQYLKLTGQIGIKIAVKLALFSYQLVLVSGSAGYSWDWGAAAIQNYWKTAGSGYDNGSSLYGTNQLSASGQQALASTMLQSREYLEDFARSYGNIEERAVLYEAGLNNLIGGNTTVLQENANPSSDLQRSDDGKILLYVSDCGSTSIYDSRVAAGSSIDNAAVIPSPDSFDGTGDFNPVLAGTEDMAVAAWVRMNAVIPEKDAGDVISPEEQSLLLNSTEVMASVYTEGQWNSTRLTDNKTPDLAPAAAANGTKAIAAWRSVYADDPERPADFMMDQIHYRIFNGTEWETTEYTLYNGTAGAVKAIQAAMLPDGTAIVVYAIDYEGNGLAEDYEIAYSLVNADGTPGATMIATRDKQNDENPKVAAVHFGDNDDRFVIGWYSSYEGSGDVKLLAVDGNGIMSNTFPESISVIVSAGDADISGDFCFADMVTGSNDLDNLTIIWSETVNVPEVDGEEIIETPDHSVLKAAGLRRNGDAIYLTAAQQLAELPDRTLINSVDASITASGTVSAVMQATWYDPDNNIWYNMETGESVTDVNSLDEGNWTAVPQEMTYLLSAQGEMSNSITVDGISADFENLALNSLNLIRFTLRNTGIEPVTELKIELDGQPDLYVSGEVSELNPLLPNGSTIINCYYAVGNELHDPDYTVTAVFASGEEKDSTGSVYLSYPDIGISQMEVIEESEGIRTVRVILYNNSAAALKNDIHTVKLGFYLDSDYNMIQPVSCDNPGVVVETNDTLTISGEEALKLLNEGVLTIDVKYDIGNYIEQCGETEIPEDGIRLYTTAWIIRDEVTQDEFRINDNSASVLLESLLYRSGETVTTGVIQDNTQDATSAKITLRNNSLQNQNRGALVATLLDEEGAVLEQQQIALSETMKGESEQVKDIQFSVSGVRVDVTAGLLNADNDDSTLSELTFDGLPIALDGFKADSEDGVLRASVETENSSTIVKFTAQSSQAKVTINGEDCDEWYGSKQADISFGTSVIKVIVKNNNDETEYELTIRRPDPSSALAELKLDDAAIDLTEFTAGEGGKLTDDFTTSNDSITVYAKAQSEEAEVTINGESFDGQSGSKQIDTPIGNTVISITVKNGESETEYELNVYHPDPSSALAELKLDDSTADLAEFTAGENGKLTDDFTTSNDSITVNFRAQSKEAKVTVNGESFDGQSGSKQIDTPIGNTVITVTVKNGESETEYELNVYHPDPSSALAELKLDDTTADLAEFTAGEGGKLTDDFTTANDSITVSFRAQSKEAKVTINGESFDGQSGSTQVITPIGNTVITVTVKNGESETEYELNVYHPDPSSALAELKLDDSTADLAEFTAGEGGKLTDDFTTANDNVTISFRAQSKEAKVTVNGESFDGQSGSKEVETPIGNTVITVTVKNGESETEYELNVYHPDPSSALADFSLENLSFALTDFTEGEDGILRASFDTEFSSMILNFKAQSSQANIIVNGESIDDSSGSKQVDIPVGTSVINVTVTNGDSETVYELTVMRPDPSSELAELDFENLDIALEDFTEGEDGILRASVDTELSSMTLNFRAQSDRAKVKVNGTDFDERSGSMQIKVPFGTSVINVTVTNGDNETVYELTVRRTLRPSNRTISDYLLYLKALENNKTEEKADIPETESKKPVLPFIDISPDDKWYDAVCDVYERKLMIGISDDKFGPGLPMTRAMIVTTLYRMEGEPAADGNCTFLDIDMDSWYGPAVAWAAQNGIVYGYSKTEFGPMDNITREQLATIFSRYALMKGYDTGSPADTSEYKDNAEISDWAADAMAWALGMGGLESEDSMTIKPKADALRWQAAVMLFKLGGYTLTETDH